MEQTAGATSDKDQVGEKVNTSMNNEEIIPAPLAGKVIPLSEVPDAVFSSGAMGKGFAIEPTDNKLYAPFDSSVVMLAPTKHAIGLRSEFGVELLVHVGIDTVSLDGSAFTLHIKEGSKVKKGDLLMTFDQEAIECKGLKTITPAIINQYTSVRRCDCRRTIDMSVNRRHDHNCEIGGMNNDITKRFSMGRSISCTSI